MRTSETNISYRRSLIEGWKMVAAAVTPGLVGGTVMAITTAERAGGDLKGGLIGEAFVLGLSTVLGVGVWSLRPRSHTRALKTDSYHK